MASHATTSTLPAAFDPRATLESIREQRAVRRHHRTWGKSRLAKHRAELVKLRAEGASLADLVFWLRKTKRIVVVKTTVQRFLAKLPESANGD
jgi:hypothetical protein